MLPQTTWSGVSGPFLSGCHWAASAGSWEARSLNPGQGRFPAQYGQPLSAPVRLILPAWLSYLALDAGLREQENEVEVLLVHTPAADVLKCCEPSDVNKLNHQACRTPLGEFAFSSVTSSGLVSTEELFLDLMNLALDSADVKCLMLLPFHQVYGNGVEEKLAGFFKDKSEEERGKVVYFITEEPLSPVYCRLEPVFYSLAHAFGIKSDEL